MTSPLTTRQAAEAVACSPQTEPRVDWMSADAYAKVIRAIGPLSAAEIANLQGCKSGILDWVRAREGGLRPPELCRDFCADGLLLCDAAPPARGRKRSARRSNKNRAASTAARSAPASAKRGRRKGHADAA